MNKEDVNKRSRQLIKSVKKGIIDPMEADNYLIRYAAENGLIEVISFLLKDERVNPAAGGNYALECAAENGHFEVVQRLLEDERVDIRNETIIKAMENGHGKIVELLLKDKRAKVQDFFDYVLKQLPEKLRAELKNDLEQHIKDIGWC